MGMDDSETIATIEVTIVGMTCEGCVRRVRTALAGVTGLEHAEVQLGKARLEFYPHVITAERLRGMIAALGYAIPGPPRRRSLFGRFLDRMIETNEKTFGNERLDCCTMKKR
jgi:copper chaperone